ncbi:hypothetical protein FHS29_005386 [Saccharothrix tamanrassetensis]|uniref:Glycosyltransferase RgtA/B/C/D-like domain-containing protein n=1 Tax=Saccharothrix tamanrassetensis TaxID=1051531 RepID=A0A841CRW9_9PSEU|nr:hypothetical protein [Saccharothrix tamanrassetensis]MBB5958777.1 hypothetical protein [Saccharothrix tamanrassetensis]
MSARRGPGFLARWFGREGTLVVLLGFALSAAFNWPVVRNPKSVVAGDLGDPLLQAWELAWHRRFLTEGGDLWTTNMFFPSEDNFAFSDSLLGYFPLAVFGDGQYAAVMRYNVAYIIAFALAFIGGYFLARQLGGNWQAALLAGAVFAWAPWRLLHSSHLNILSSGGIALALYALARGHGYSFRSGARPGLARPGWVVAGWLLAAWQITIGFATGIPFFYLMAGVGVVTLVVVLRRRAEFGDRVLVANGVGGAVFVAVTLMMAIPYLQVVERYGFTRAWKEIAELSAPPAGLLTVSDMSWLWRGSVFDSAANLPLPAPWEKMLFPGLALVVPAVVGLFVSVWSKRLRTWLAVAAVVVAVLALGSGFFDGAVYRLLWEFLPGWNSMRTPGRLVMWVVLLLSLLAVGAVTRLGQLLAERVRNRRLVALALVVPAVFALLEGLPVRQYPHVPGIPSGLKTVFEQVREPMVIVPMDNSSEVRYLLWSTEGWPTMANGNSGNYPLPYVELHEVTRNFPNTHTIDVLDKHGIRAVVVMKSTVVDTPWADILSRPTAGYPITRTETTDAVLFTIKP